MQKIKNVSRILKWAAIATCAGLPLIEAGYWITNGYPFLDSMYQVAPLPSFGNHPVTWSSLTEGQKLLGFFASMIPIVFFMAALLYLTKLFSSFQRLELFEEKNARILKKAGWAIVWSQLLYPVYLGFLSLILTFTNPVGERNLTIGFGSSQLAIFLIGLAVILISWIFEEAGKMHEEQAATV